MFRLLLLALRIGPRIIFSFFCWILKYSRNPKKYPLEERYSRIHSLLLKLFKLMKVDLKMDGYEYLNKQKKKSLIVANHQSMIDIVLLIALSEEPVTFVAKSEVCHMPFVGKILKALEGEFLDRDNPRQAITVLKNCSEKIKNNYCHVCIYPEGHRTTDPFNTMLEFHPGSFKIAYWAECPILYFAEFGTFRILDFKENSRRFPIFVKFFEPQNYETFKNITTNEYAPKIRETILKQVSKFIEEDNYYHQNKLYKKNKNNREKWWIKYQIH